MLLERPGQQASLEAMKRAEKFYTMYQMYALQEVTGLDHDAFDTFSVEKFLTNGFGQRMSEVAEEEIALFIAQKELLEAPDEEIEDMLNTHHDYIVHQIKAHLKFFRNDDDILQSGVEIDGQMY